MKNTCILFTASLVVPAGLLSDQPPVSSDLFDAFFDSFFPRFTLPEVAGVKLFDPNQNSGDANPEKGTLEPVFAFQLSRDGEAVTDEEIEAVLRRTAVKFVSGDKEVPASITTWKRWRFHEAGSNGWKDDAGTPKSVAVTSATAFPIGTVFKTAGKNGNVCTVTDILVTRNAAGAVVDTRYVNTHEFKGATITDRTANGVTVARGLISRPGVAA